MKSRVDIRFIPVSIVKLSGAAQQNFRSTTSTTTVNVLHCRKDGRLLHLVGKGALAPSRHRPIHRISSVKKAVEWSECNACFLCCGAKA